MTFSALLSFYFPKFIVKLSSSSYVTNALYKMNKVLFFIFNKSMSTHTDLKFDSFKIMIQYSLLSFDRWLISLFFTAYRFQECYFRVIVSTTENNLVMAVYAGERKTIFSNFNTPCRFIL